jgi:hypothetical protein
LLFDFRSLQRIWKQYIEFFDKKRVILHIFDESKHRKTNTASKDKIENQVWTQRNFVIKASNDFQTICHIYPHHYHLYLSFLGNIFFSIILTPTIITIIYPNFIDNCIFFHKTNIISRTYQKSEFLYLYLVKSLSRAKRKAASLEIMISSTWVHMSAI